MQKTTALYDRTGKWNVSSLRRKRNGKYYTHHEIGHFDIDSTTKKPINLPGWKKLRNHLRRISELSRRINYRNK